MDFRDYALSVIRLRIPGIGINTRAKMVSGTSFKAMLGTGMFQIRCKAHTHALFLMSHGPQI